MPLRVVLSSAIFGLIFMAAGCAEVPTVMRYHPESNDRAGQPVWPPAPEDPRYRFAGQLTGEQNFGLAQKRQPNVAERAFRWLVGLGARGRGEPDVLTRPQTGTVDAGGRIYITDVGRPAVFVFDESEGKLFIWDQADGNVPFVSPIGIAAMDTVNEVLVADSVLARIVRLDFEGQPIGSFGQGILQRPTGLAWDPQSGSLFVADTQTHSIKVFDAKGTFVREIGRQGSAPGEFNAPTHLAFKGGRLYVSDTLNARIQVLTAAGKPLKTVGQRGLYLGNLTRPKGVTVDTEGRVYVVESYYDHLLIFDDKGQFLLPIGGTGSAIGKFYLPAGAWSDQRDRIFVADMFNGRVIIFEYLGT